MDIDRYTFPGRALEMLEAIASSSFVAIDCEFSGVSRSANKGGLQSLEERYAETRKAAKKFHILQVGITCGSLISTDPQEYYCLRPYNINISPVITEELDVERDFTFQSGAVEFLLRNNFNFGGSLSTGVRYLSRAEEIEALAVAETKALRIAFEDIVLTDTDVEALEFVDQARKAIRKWSRTGKPKQDFFTISSRKDLGNFSPSKNQQAFSSKDLELTSFDRRLIHQLVRSEFPDLRTMTRMGNITVMKYDAKREKDAVSNRINKAKRMVQENIGFRLIVEALFGGTESLESMDIKAFSYAETNANGQKQKGGSSSNFYELVARKADIIQKLKSKPVVLVGHNIFGDLAYLYQHFISDLPETLEEYRLMIRQNIPYIIDTKYMATHNCGSLQPPSSLEQLAESLRNQKDPGYGIPVGFEKYLEDETTGSNSQNTGLSSPQYLHEAGYDGYVTAQVFLKLTSQLGGSLTHLDSTFWREYGNRLRVFGTVETLFDLMSLSSSITSAVKEDTILSGVITKGKR